MEFLCEIEFEIKHVKEKENKVVNALSRKFHIIAISVCMMDLRARVLKSMDNNKFYLQVKEEL